MGLTFVDLFCGIGTIRMGMEEASHECVYSVEWDKHKRKIYSIIFGKEPEGADIRTTKSTDIPRADVWTFGAPCQDFSIAGKRAGMEGERSSLILEVFRLVRETSEEDRPKYLIYENVKGMLSGGGGRDFLGILSEMASLGYDFIEYSLLNSKDFGVPQNRERVFTIGHYRKRSTRKVFPLVSRMDCTNPAVTLTVRGYGSQRNGTYVIENTTRVKQLFNIMANGKRENPNQGKVYDLSGLSPTLSKMEGGGRQPMILQTARGYNEGGLHEISPTLTKNSWEHNNHLVDGATIRRLTPKECWRLQGIPDSTTDKVIQAGISDTQMYRGAGDACTVNVIYEIAKKLT